MKIVVAPDAFRECLTSFEVGQAIRNGIEAVDKQAEISVVGIADDGQEYLDVIKCWDSNVQEVTLKTQDLLGRSTDSMYLIVSYKGDPMAVINSANTAGIHLLDKPDTTTFEQATSFGIGVQIRDAIQRGLKRVLVLTGDTGVCDGGLGMLQALGLNFFDENGHLIGKNVNLLSTNFKRVSGLEVVLKQFKRIGLMVSTDLRTIYSGREGAQFVEGPSKGGNPQQIEKYDQKMQEFQEMARMESSEDVMTLPGTGVDGGIVGALTLLGGEIQSQFDLMAGFVGLSKKIMDADILITGTGSLGYQADHKKAVDYLVDMANDYDVPVIVIAGQLNSTINRYHRKKASVFSIQRRPSSLQHALKPEYAVRNIEFLTKNIIKALKDINYN